MRHARCKKKICRSEVFLTIGKDDASHGLADLDVSYGLVDFDVLLTYASF
jgi:hypothetical protein